MRASSGGQRSKSRTDKIRLLVADDHVTVLEGLVAIIGRQPDMQVVAAASNGREAVDLWRTNRPDVTLLDRMPILTVLAPSRKYDSRSFRPA
jgi:YesN/AraC family two-component response regulator